MDATFFIIDFEGGGSFCFCASVLVVVVTAAGLVILMGAVEQAASPGTAGVQAELNWHRHSSIKDDHVSESILRRQTKYALE